MLGKISFVISARKRNKAFIKSPYYYLNQWTHWATYHSSNESLPLEGSRHTLRTQHTPAACWFPLIWELMSKQWPVNAGGKERNEYSFGFWCLTTCLLFFQLLMVQLIPACLRRLNELVSLKPWGCLGLVNIVLKVFPQRRTSSLMRPAC